MRYCKILNEKLLVLCLFSAVISCATHPDKIPTTYVSPLKYKDYTCDQIALESDYIGQRVNDLYHRLKKNRSGDKWKSFFGLTLFSPLILFMNEGDGIEATEYSQLKGEYEALRKVSIEKKCGISIKSPDEIMRESFEADKEKQEE